MAGSEKIHNQIFNYSTLSKYFRLLSWFDNYGKFELMCDIIAGISIALTLMPQSIAYAALMDLSPQYGLNSTFVGCILYSLFGTIKEVSIGPAAVISVITLEYIYHLNGDFAILLTFLVGLTEMMMGILKLGFLIDYISLPVSCGYITALAITIACSQLKGLFGLKFKSKNFIDNMHNFFSNLMNIKLSDTVVGFFCIACLLLLQFVGSIKIKRESRICNVLKKILWFLSIARNAIVVFFGITVAYVFENYYSSIPFDVAGGMREGLPSINFPPVNTIVNNHFYSFMDMVKQLNSAIIIIPIMSITTNVVISKAHNQGHLIEANAELFALGFCNVFASFVGSLPVCGAITRSVVGHTSNIQSPISGIFTGIVAILTLCIFTPYFNMIPRATLSAVLLTCVIFLIKWPVMLLMWKSDRKDLLVMLLTIIFSLTCGLAKGLFLSILLSILRLIYLWSSPKTTVSTCLTVSGHQYVEITPDKGLYFPSVENLRSVILKQNKSMAIVINCKNVTGLDFTALKELYSLVTDFNEQGQRIILKCTNTKFKRKWNTINTSDTVSAFCNTNCDLDKMLFGHMNKEIIKEDSLNKSEMIPLTENHCKNEVINESET